MGSIAADVVAAAAAAAAKSLLPCRGLMTFLATGKDASAGQLRSVGPMPSGKLDAEACICCWLEGCISAASVTVAGNPLLLATGLLAREVDLAGVPSFRFVRFAVRGLDGHDTSCKRCCWISHMNCDAARSSSAAALPARNNNPTVSFARYSTQAGPSLKIHTSHGCLEGML